MTDFVKNDVRTKIHNVCKSTKSRVKLMLKSVKEVELKGKMEPTLAPKDVDTMDAQITEAESVMHPNVGVMEISKETLSTLVSSADSSHTVEVVSSKLPIESRVKPPLSAPIIASSDHRIHSSQL